MNWQTLAPELIFQILSKFLPGLALPVVEPEFFPWYLGHICSSWRAVFKSSPQFWSSLVVNTRDVRRRINVKRTLLLTEMAIQQSRNHPLTFQFRIGDGNYLSHCHKMLLEALTAQSTRWLNAYFYLPCREASLLYAIKTQFPILRTLRLTYPYHDSDGMAQFGDLFEDAPRVRHVHIIDYPVWKLNWSLITTLHLKFTNEVQLELLVNFLQTIDRLEELHLQCCRHTSSGSPPRIVLPFLRCLGLATMEYLLFFETPVLEELYIQAWDTIPLTRSAYDWVPSLVRLLELNHLKKLVLLLTNIGTTIWIFQYLPETQNIDFYVTDPSILTILPLCPLAPRLETMTIGVLYQPLADILRIFKFWGTYDNAATGFGRFEGLKRFTFKLQNEELMSNRKDSTQEYFDEFEFELTSLFSERGVQCSILQVLCLLEQDVAVPPFDTFEGQEADYFNYLNYHID